jgi:hypothetical protein
LTSQLIFAPQAIWKTPDHILLQKILQKIFIVTDKISESVNDSDSDGGRFSEISGSGMCTVDGICSNYKK